MGAGFAGALVADGVAVPEMACDKTGSVCFAPSRGYARL